STCRPLPSTEHAPHPPRAISLHDALPISAPALSAATWRRCPGARRRPPPPVSSRAPPCHPERSRRISAQQPRPQTGQLPRVAARSEEHTSELQSRFDLVCRLLLETKNSIR